MWSIGTTLNCIVFFATTLAAQGPKPIFSTFWGVADCDGIALGAKGDVYLACHSPSNHLTIDARPSKLPASDDDLDAYVMRLNPKSGKLIYATCVGGGGYDEASRIKVDKNGFAYVVGFTKSHDFPTRANALQTQFGGGASDAFLLKVAPDGQVVYATLLGCANRTTQAEIFQPPAAEFSGTGHCLLLRISGLLSPRLMIIGGTADPCNLRAFDVSYRKHEITPVMNKMLKLSSIQQMLRLEIDRTPNQPTSTI